MKGYLMDIFESLENLPVSEECFDEIMGIVEELINEVSAEKIQGTANQRAYDAGKAGSFQFNYGLKTQKGKKSLAKLAKFKDLLKRREDRTGEQAVNHNEMQDSHDKGWEDAKDIMEK